MTLKYALSIILKLSTLAVLLLLSLSILYGFFLLINKYVFKKPIKKLDKEVLLSISLIVYLLALLFVTLVDHRVYGVQVNFDFFSTYRSMIANVDTGAFIYAVLNILMTIPLGILLPLNLKSAKKPFSFIFTSLVLILVIEALQFITQRGVTDINDVFHNLVGALIGYGVISILFKSKKEKNKLIDTFLYLSPLLLTLGIISFSFLHYNLKPYGNLSIAGYNRIDIKTKNIIVSDELDLSSESVSFKANQFKFDHVPIYRKINFNDFSEDQLFTALSGENIEEQSQYTSLNRSYDTYTNQAKTLNIERKSQAIEYSNYSNEPNEEPFSREALHNYFDTIDIGLPDWIRLEADFSFINSQWIWESKLEEYFEYLLDGDIIFEFDKENEVFRFLSNLSLYEPVSTVAIKNLSTIIMEFKEGKFATYYNEFNTVELRSIRLSYLEDSKFYLQPVYELDLLLDSNEITVQMPAMK